MITNGHAAGLMGFEAAVATIAGGAVDTCVVSGVDSYYDADTLAWLDETGRLLSAMNRNGFAPSEAAGACLLASRAFAEAYGLPILGEIVAASSSWEHHGIRDGGVCIGAGLTSALKGATSDLVLPGEAIQKTYCDLNGERYRSEELVYALLRLPNVFVDANDFDCPADCWGDVGAASGPLLVSLAALAQGREYGDAARCLVWAGSEGGDRSAVVLKTSAGGWR